MAHNRAAWDREVESGNEWTRPVGPEVTHLTEAPHHADATGRYMPGYIATRAVRP